MKARTKFQKKIVALSNRLPKLSTAQVIYLREELFEHGATLLKSGKLSCLDCGHQWIDKGAYLAGVILGEECPNCHRQLKVQRTQKKVFALETYYQVVSVFEGHQVVRVFIGRKYLKAGEPQRFTFQKVYENWITEDGQIANVGYYQTSKWYESWGGGYELRSDQSNSDYRLSLENKAIYPRISLIKVLKRNGLTKDFHDCNPPNLFHALLNKPKAETLLKAKQYHLLNQYVMDSRRFEENWASIKICIRNKYYVAEPIEWLDYVGMLKDFDKDVHNPKYICPKNMMLQHNIYVDKKQKRRQKQKLEEQRQEIEYAQRRYEKMKKPYIGLVFSNDLINVSFMNTVEEVMIDSDELRHCSFSSKYYEKKTLLFSAKIDEKRIATIEYNPEKNKIVQLRGYHNQMTNYDQQITSLFEHNINKIADCTKPKPKAKRKRKQPLAMAS